MSITQFDKIFHGTATEVGKFRIASQGVAWKALDSEASIAIPQADIKWAEWMRVARNFQLRIGLSTSKSTTKESEHTRETFDGFQRDDQEKVSKLLKQFFDVALETRDMTFKGWNWGATDFRGQDLAFLVSNKMVFEVPLSTVANSNIVKTEVSLEFSTGSSVKKGRGAPDELVEMRFYVPGSRMKEMDSEDEGAEKVEKKKKKKKVKETSEGEGEGSDKENNDKEGEEKEKEGSEDDEGDDEDDQNAAEQFHSLIRERSSRTSQTASGTLLISFVEVFVATPRGRYDVAMYQTFLRLRGKTYDYKILYNNITRLFLLPKDEQSVQFIIGLSPPIRQGQTRYSYLVMNFPRDENMEAEIDMEQEAIDEEYGGKLQKHYDAPTFQVVSSVFRALSGKKVIGQTREDAQGIKCTLKANPGEIHLLEKSIIYIGKQPIFIEHNDINQILFSRVGNALGTARTFDLTISTRSGPSYTFSAVNRDEHEEMENYLKAKKIRVTNQMADDVLNELIGEDDSDEEMQSIASSGSDEPQVRRGADVNDEDSEVDEDFKASSSDNGSPSSGSESEDNSDASEDASAKKKKSKPKPSAKAKGKQKASSDVEASPPKKKKKAPADGEVKKKPKPKPKAKKAEDDAMDVDEVVPPKKKDAPKPRPKPRPAKKAEEGGEGPAKKKQKKDSSD